MPWAHVQTPSNTQVGAPEPQRGLENGIHVDGSSCCSMVHLVVRTAFKQWIYAPWGKMEKHMHMPIQAP